MTDDLEDAPDAPDDEVALPDTDPVTEPVPENDPAIEGDSTNA